MKFKWGIIVTVIFLLLVGCSSTGSGPTEIKQNTDSCDVCKMGIQELNSAAQMILEDGKPVLFDDIGCMIVYIQQEQPEYKDAFVHDFESKEWIPFEKSTFVHDQSIDSPMSYGIVAFDDEGDAANFQEDHGGELYSNKDLVASDMKSFKKSGMENSH